MSRRFLSSLILLAVLSLVIYTVLLNPTANPSRASQDPTVVNQTRGCEMRAEILGNEFTIALRNNHKETVTAFAISLDNAFEITEDFAYSDVHFGVEPGDVFQKRYLLPASLTGSVPTFYLLTAVLKNGKQDGNSLAAQKIKDERLGEKVQILRTLRILERQQTTAKDVGLLKSDVVAALNAPDPETLITLKELQAGTPSRRTSSNTLSDDIRRGLQAGREKMIRSLNALAKTPSESRESAVTELKARASNLLTKL